MTGAGSGEYTSTYGTRWTQVTEGGAVRSGVTGFRLATGILSHEGQVGAGTSEAYYKAIQASVTPDTVIPGTTVQCFTSAEGVGKVNYTCDPGYNLVTVPFKYLSGGDTLVQVFGSQLHAGDVDTADRIYIKGDANSWGMDNAYLSTSGRWYWSNQPAVETTITIEARRGYLVRNRGAQIPITLVGKIPVGSATVSMTLGYNMIGTVFPIRLALNSLGIYGLSNVTAGTVDTADRIYIKSEANSWGMDNAYLSTDGRWYWSNKPLEQASFTFNSPRGYFYRMKGTGTINWPRTMP
jgi:hypothetical protein